MKSVERVTQFLREHNLNNEIVEFPEGTHTAQAAADAVGCVVGQIAKSLIFMTDQREPLLVITSGSNRVDTAKVERLINKKVEKATADFVYEQTGFAIGGVAPVGHLQPVIIFIDEDLLHYDLIWAAAGSPRHVFTISPQVLVEITGGKVADVKLS
jgi:prolyl-tRNA editing enzyme YbaK/EbsC (Cys-tRNA(Pro) deacylase)